MNKIRKILLTVCSVIFALSLCLAFGFSQNAKVKADEEEVEIDVVYACIQYNNNPQTYTFVLETSTGGNPSFSVAYDTTVYFDGKALQATVKDSNCLYVNRSLFTYESGSSFLLEIPAGTYLQTDKVLKNSIVISLKYTTDNTDGNQGIFSMTKKAFSISETPYSIELHKVSWAMAATLSNNFYFTIPDEDNTIKSGATADWENYAQYSPLGNAITINGVAITSNLQKCYSDKGTSDHYQSGYIALTGDRKVGDVLTFDGWFTNDTYGAFKIENTSFVYDGKTWGEANSKVYQLEASTTTDTNPQNGIYLSMEPNDIPVSTANNGWDYSTVSVGATGYYNDESVTIKFRKYSATDWYLAISEMGKSAIAGDVVTLSGWFYCTDSDGATHFIKIATTSYQFDGTSWTDVSPTIDVCLKGSEISDTLYVTPGQSISDVTATASNDGDVSINFADAVENDVFVLREGESVSEYVATFSVLDSNGMVFLKQISVSVGFEDFVMEEGAAVRIAGDNVNGLRFSAEMSQETYEGLKAQGATFGMVIVPRDYISDGYELTSANLFGSNAKFSATAELGASQSVRRMLLIENLTPQNVDSDTNYEIRGAITDILTSNLTREFVGVAYVLVNGEYVVASWYGDNMDNNARSMYYVAQRAIDAGVKVDKIQSTYIDVYSDYLTQKDKVYNITYTVNHHKTRKGTTEVVTETYTAPVNSTVIINANDYSSEGFVLNSFISSVTTKLYVNKANVIDFYYKDVSLPDIETVAWHHPTLDSSNDYMNETNKAIAETMSSAGFNAVMLNGSDTVGDLYLNSSVNIEQMKNVINMFWTYGGIKTLLSAKNASNSTEFVTLENYKNLQDDMASLAECEGFGGFFAWDEPLPTSSAFERIAEYAEWFVVTYGDTATFMVNLYPSYYDAWSSGDYTSYSAYIKAYCDIVLSKIEKGVKYISMDSYPINASGDLDQTFMYDMAVLKHYALEYGAQANAILQACGWDHESHYEAPSEAEYRLMYYTALAFGMDSIGWWGYAPETTSDNPTITDTPVNLDNTTNDAYDCIKNVITEVNAFGSIYKTYDWQGVIMSSPSSGFLGFGADAQYDAFQKVKSDSLLSEYMLSASDTSAFSSISGSGSNYVISVMQDANGNEAFTIVNYSAPTDNKTLTITLTPKVNGDYTIYTSTGSEVVSMTTSGYSLTLAPGGGAFITSSDTTHSVVFKDEDGTVLYETTCKFGETPSYGGTTPTKEGYTFAGWSPALGAITGNTEYTATYTELPTVTFVNWDGTVLQSSKWAFNSTPSYSGATPTKDDAEFIGWTPAITAVTGNATYTAVFSEKYVVTYVNCNGTFDETTEEILGGKTISYVPTLDGYVFKGWTLDGALYDVNEAVSGDMTLVATWYKLISNGEKTVMSASDVHANTDVEPGYGNNTEDGTGATTNSNYAWFYDSDYNGYSGDGKDLSANQFLNLTNITLTADGGAGTVEGGRMTYLDLPAINYQLYTKVDFAYTVGTSISAVKICDTTIDTIYNNTLISIRTDSTCTYLYYQELNTYGTANWAKFVVELPESIANGSERLRLNLSVNNWFRISLTEFHMTPRATDYMATITDVIAKLEANVNDEEALVAYIEAETCLTDYERANLEISDVVVTAQDNYLANAVLKASADDLINAIEEYRTFNDGLTDEQKATENHQINLANVNHVIDINFYELGEEVTLTSIASISISGEKNAEINANSKFYNSTYNGEYTYSQFSYMTSSTDSSANFTFNLVDYSAYAEVGFGYAMAFTGDVGTITINEKSYTIPATLVDHFYKARAVISSGYLTLYDDTSSSDVLSNDTNYLAYGYFFKVKLSDSVNSGVEPLVINYQMATSYCWLEVTEMHAIPFVATTETITNAVSATNKNEENIAMANYSKFYGYGYDQFTYLNNQNPVYDSTEFTMIKFDYLAYSEVRFGLAMVYTGGTGVLTVDGTALPAALNGYWYYTEAVIKDGYLTLVNLNSPDVTLSNDSNYKQYGYFQRVKLSDDVLNGTKALTFNYNLGSSYGWFEITNMIAVNKRVPKITTSVVDNDVNWNYSGTTISNDNYAVPSNWGESCQTAFQTATYSKYNLAQFAEQSTAYTVNLEMPAFNFDAYSEAYFGFTAATAVGDATVTVNGKSYTYDLNDGYVYVKMIVKDGVLTVVGDGSNNLGQVYFTVELSEDVLNGTDSLVVTWQTAGWSQVELTEIHTNTWVDSIV